MTRASAALFSRGDVRMVHRARKNLPDEALCVAFLKEKRQAEGRVNRHRRLERTAGKGCPLLTIRLQGGRLVLR